MMHLAMAESTSGYAPNVGCLGRLVVDVPADQKVPGLEFPIRAFTDVPQRGTPTRLPGDTLIWTANSNHAGSLQSPLFVSNNR